MTADTLEKSTKHKNIFRLEDLSDYKVADGYHDVRNWPVVGQGGFKIGRVEHLIVDKAAQRVRYIEVEMDDNWFKDEPKVGIDKSSGVHFTLNRDGDQHMLVPIGMVRLDADHDKVLADAIHGDMLKNYPRHNYSKGLTHEHEDKTLDNLIGKQGNAVAFAGHWDGKEAYCEIEDDNTVATTATTHKDNISTIDKLDYKHENKDADKKTDTLTGKTTYFDHYTNQRKHGYQRCRRPSGCPPE